MMRFSTHCESRNQREQKLCQQDPLRKHFCLLYLCACVVCACLQNNRKKPVCKLRCAWICVGFCVVFEGQELGCGLACLKGITCVFVLYSAACFHRRQKNGESRISLLLPSRLYSMSHCLSCINVEMHKRFNIAPPRSIYILTADDTTLYAVCVLQTPTLDQSRFILVFY